MATGVANDTVVNSGGNLYVSSGGTTDNTVVNSYGRVYAYNNGTADNVTVNYGGFLCLSGGTANIATVNSGGNLYVSNGGVADNTIVNNGGSICVFNGGNARHASVESYGNIYVYSGGEANDAIANNRGYIFLEGGGVVNNATVNSGGVIEPYGKGIANNITVNSAGLLWVLSGGTANNAIVNSGGRISISSCGLIYNTTLSGGNLYISSGGTADHIIVNERGYLHIFNGGKASNLSINSGGTIYTENGVVFDNATINSGGYLHISSGCTADNATVKAGGYLHVSQGGIATNVIWTPCVGSVFCAEGAYATFVSQYSGVYFGSDNQLLSHVQIVNSQSISNAIMYVMSAGKANATLVNSSGIMYVSNGGIADNTIVNFGGNLFVSGGTTGNTMVSANGWFYLFSGGEADHTSVEGFMSVGNCGVANNTIVDAGSMYICSGGTANSTLISGGSGKLYISNGGTAESSIVNSCGYVVIYSSGIANNTIVNTFGSLCVLNGGTATITFNPWQGNIISSAGASVTYLERDANIYYGGTLQGVISKADVLDSLVVESGNSAIVYSGGSANNITVKYGGDLYVSEGGTATVTFSPLQGNIVSGEGAIITYLERDANVYYIESTGEIISKADALDSIVVESGNSAIVYSGGTAENIKIKYGGTLYVSEGGTATVTFSPLQGNIVSGEGATITYLERDANVYYIGSTGEIISKANVLDSLVVEPGNSAIVYSGGTADNITVKYGGSLYVSEGGTANIAFNPWRGTIVSDDGASVTHLERDAFIYYGNLADGIVCKTNDLNSFDVDSGKSAIIYSGGIANNTNVKDTGLMVISSGGTAMNITAESGAWIVMHVAPDTYVEGTINGNAFEMKDAYLSDYTVYSSGCLHVSNGGTVENIIVKKGGSLCVSSSGVANNTIISGNAIVANAGKADNTTIATSAYLFVSSGGVANNITVAIDGNLVISSGGTATDISTSSRARIELYVASDTYVQGTYNGSAFVIKDAFIADYSINLRNSLHVLSGGVARNIDIISSGCLYVSSGGSAEKTEILNAGSMFIFEGGSADNIIVTYGGRLYISNGGIANNTIIYERGNPLVYSGAILNNTTVNSMGSLSISKGVIANNVTINSSGQVRILSSGTVDMVSVNPGGVLYVSNGGTATQILENGGYVNATSNSNVTFIQNAFSGHVVSSRGFATLHSGTTAINMTIAQTGSVTIYSGGTVNHVFNSGGTLTLSSGGKLTGRIINYNGRINGRGIVDFDLTQVAPGTGARICGFSAITGTHTFTITVNENQTEGIYTLASEVSSFNKTISVISADGEELGSISLENTLTVSNIDYILSLSNNKLYLKIGEEIPESPYTSDGLILTQTASVSSGNIFHDTVILPYARLNVLGDGLADGTEILNTGAMIVSSGGSADNTVISGGSFSVQSGGTANSIIINSNGLFNVHRGGTANDITVNPGGSLGIANGGSATTIRENGGYINVNDNENITFVKNVISECTVFSSASATIHSGTTAIRTSVFNRGLAIVYSGGTASYSEIGYNGRLLISSGGIANNTIINQYGYIEVYSSGIADNTTINSGGYLYIINGTANNTFVNNGTVLVSNGGILDNTIVNDNGQVRVSVGGVIDNTTINKNGQLNILNGGIAGNTTVNGGTLNVYSGGTATNVDWTPCVGSVGVAEGAHVTFASQYTGVYYGSNNQLLSHGQTINSQMVSSAVMCVMSAGTATATVVNNYGSMYISGGGFADNTTIKTGGRLYISKGGSANQTDINGYLYVYNGAKADNITINSGGYLSVSSGGTATNVDWTPCVGSVGVAEGAHVTFASQHTGVYYGYNNQLLSHAQMINSKSLSSAVMYVMTDGMASATIINYYGSMYVSNAGFADDTTVNSGGYLYVFNGGKIDNTTVNSSGYLSVSSGGIVDKTTVKYLGQLRVFSGGIANNTMVNANGFLYVSSGGIADNTTLNNSGLLYIYNGGTADNTTINSGWMYVSSGGTANNTTINSGWMYVSGGGTADNTAVNAKSYLYVSNGGTVDNTTVNSNGYLYVSNGGIANTTTVNQFGRMIISNGGKANDITASTLGAVDVLNGGTIDNITISRGCVNVASSGKLTGQMYFELDIGADSCAIFAVGGILDFNISNLKSNVNAFLINDLSLVQGTPTFTLTVSDFQESGSYILADGATDFNSSISVQNTLGESFGSLTVGSMLSAGNTDYSLNLVESSLTLMVIVHDVIPPTVFNIAANITAPTNQAVTVTADFADDVELAASLYRIGENGEWLNYVDGVTLDENNTIYFKAVDAEGNVSEIASYTVSNIDKMMYVDFGISDFVAPTIFNAGETVSFGWTLSKNAKMPVDGVRQSLYLVNADDPNRKTLLKSVYLTDLPGFGETAAQTLDLTWNDTMGYTNSLFQVVVEADGDVQPDDNTAISTSQYHFEQKLSIEKLPDSFTENTGRIRVVARRTGSPDEALSAQIVLTDASGLVSTPQTVTFAAGESEKVFYLTVGDNAEYQGNVDIQVGLQAQGYEGYSQSVTLTDDELPSLSFAVAAEELTEGDTFTAFGKVQLDHALDHDLRVKLAYDKTQLSGIPDYVVIKAGETEAAFALTVIDDATAEIDKTIKLAATADGVKSGTASLLIHDNDVPAIALSVNKTVISEGDGVYALVGTITRTDNSTNYVKVKFADVDNSGLILPSTVTLGTGAQSVNFYIGIVDNALVDGDRTATVKANIYIDSCGCTVIPVSGETQVSFTILDNDGEALGLSFSKSNVAENTTGAARLTITRNTVNGDALTVNLSVTGSSLLDLPETVQFEAGQNSVTIDVNTLTDGVNTGNQMAVVTASAEGYASAAGYLNISDVDLPDFVISEVSPAETPAYAGKTTLVNLTLANSGFQTYSGKVNVKLSLSNGTELGTYKVNGPFEVGETKQVGFYVNLPEITGTQTILAEVDPDNLISELNDGNNTAFSASFEVKLDYIVTVETEPEVLYTKAPITVTGTTKRMDGTAIGNMPVEVLLKAATGEKLLKTASDAEGNYALTVDPSDLYAGSYAVYAGNLGSYGAAQDRVEIAGMKVNQSRTAFTWDVENRSTTAGSFTVSNLSGVALSGVTIHAVNAPDNFVFVSDGPAALDANGQLTVNYTITAAGETEGNGYELTYGWQKIDFIAESDEGVTTEFSGYFYSNPQTAVLTLSETKDVRTLYSGKESFYEFQITNTGFGDTGEIHLSLPETDLIKLISNPVIENLAYGESATVTLKIDPLALGDSLEPNAPYSGNISVSAKNADSASFAFDYTFVTNNKGNITITLTDEWTQYAANHPMLSGAKVSVYNAYTDKLITSDYSDENGIVTFTDLDEGRYTLKYFAEDHNNAQEVVTIHGGETLERNTFLHVSTVKYDWVVRPVELTDNYEIVLSTEFQTNVPSPVVTIEGPTELPELAWGESTLMNFTVTNHGLIAAQDFTLNLSELQMGYEWEVLNDQPVDIAPNSSVNYTVKLKRGITSISTTPAQAVEYAYDEAGNAIGMKSTRDGITTICDFDGTILSQTDGETIVNFFYDDDMNLAYYEETDISGESFARYDSKGNTVSCGIPGMTFSLENGLITDVQVDDSNIYNCQFNADNLLTSFDIETVRYHLTWENGLVVDIDYEDTSIVAIGDESDSSRDNDLKQIQDNVRLYRYFAGKWFEIGEDTSDGRVLLDKDKETIVIVHGLHNDYDEDWITQMAEACHSTGNYQIVSVYWDDWSSLGYGYIASLGTLGIVPLLKAISDYASKYLAATAWYTNNLLQGANVKTVIGHSYGAHIGGLLSKYLGSVDHFIALDPAEESTIQDTHIKQAYSSTIGWSGQVGRQWGRESADLVEVYKSSSVLGGAGEGDILSDIPFNYGHYNYLLAKTGVFDPNALYYNWDRGLFSTANHSLACNWLIDMINQEKTIGAWFNQYIKSAQGWCGIINSETHQLECVTIDSDGNKHFTKNENWEGYNNYYIDYNESIEKHAKYVDFSLDDEDVRTDLSDNLNKVKLYKCNDTYTLCVPIANLANNATITIDSLENWQSEQNNSIMVYLGDSASGHLVGKAEFQMPASSFEIVPVVLTIDENDLSNSQNINLFIKAGVNDKGEYIDYELDSSNNTRTLTVEVEEIDCTAKLLGMWYLVCEGEIVDSREEWLKTPYCCDFNYTTSSPSYYKSSSSELFDLILKLLGGNKKVLPAIMTTPKVVSTNSHCQWIYVPASASATPDGGMMSVAAVMTDSEGDGELESICAHVMMEFKQTAVMSREGFEGTLTLTNEAATEMTNITFTATVLNSAGEDVSDLFEIPDYVSVDGFSITQDGDLTQYGLGNKGTGTFTVLYVPGRYTSTEGPEDYQFTGTISYTDSLVGDVSIDLTPITLTVNPSPSLQLHYFVERDVYADNPFTDAIEKSIPAEISVLVVNAGKGDARNFSLSGLTPEIVDNQKGLLLNYTMTDAAMNGVKNDNGIVDVNFGTVAANSSAVAQWWYETNIQGHYSDYSVNFTQMDYSYVDLYGNTRYVAAANRPDVSLIESADIHELIRSVQCGDDELPDFLVDDLADDGDTPDTLYLSTGAVEDVNAVFAAVSNGTFGTNDVTITLTAEFAEGWNYLRILDPGNGDYELTGIVRDGEALNVRNFWQTDRYYLDELGVKYENRLHLLDHAEQAGTVEYTLTYTARDKNPLTVTSIAGADAVVKSAVGSLTVTFNKAVNASSFTWADLDLFRQGDLANDLITDAVTVTKINSTTFEIGNLGEFTAADGYYQLIVRTDGITDTV
ncbi:MAG: AIDA repeat-containing protein, partial [Paludibacteraceae bacterium]|nr:AIDA repeat-containing protein [Paludibacteraceae bacterium]